MMLDIYSISGVFLLGLGLNLTPCVYPMLSVTVSLFSRERQGAWLRSFARACVYVLGICIMNTALGAAAAFTGSLIGSALQNPWVLVGVAFLLFLLALSMLGVFAFQMPSWFLNKISGKRFSGIFGLFLSGLLVGVFAAPCIGPPILALLTFVGTLGDPLQAVWIFFILSLGLGFPYLILGTFAGLLHKLPKSGAWLVWIERLFGIVLLGLSGFYLMTALLPAYLKWLLPLFLAGGGIYLGFLEKSAAYPKPFNDFRRTVGVLAVGVGFMLPFLGPRVSVEWQAYSSGKLEESALRHRPVVLDFFASWCIPCHELDQFTYSDPRVIKALEPFDRYKVDLTYPKDPAAKEAAKKFDVYGMPTIVFFDREGREAKSSRMTGFVSPEEFLEAVSAADR